MIATNTVILRSLVSCSGEVPHFVEYQLIQSILFHCVLCNANPADSYRENLP